MNKVPVIFEVNPDSKHQNDLAMMCLQWGGETHHLREYILKSLIPPYSHISTHTNKTVLNWAGVMLSMEANNNNNNNTSFHVLLLYSCSLGFPDVTAI